MSVTALSFRANPWWFNPKNKKCSADSKQTLVANIGPLQHPSPSHKGVGNLIWLSFQQFHNLTPWFESFIIILLIFSIIICIVYFILLYSYTLHKAFKYNASWKVIKGYAYNAL